MNCGLGIRPELFTPVAQQRPAVGFLEAHSENYFGESLTRDKLFELRAHYPVSLHGVGLSLGRADHLNQSHLANLRELVTQVEPLIVSEHLAWSAYSHRHVPDLLPLPLNDDALAVMCEHVDQMQDVLGRQILVENPSNYLLFEQLQIPEPEFLNTLAARTGCGLLVDINNIHVSASNVGRDAYDYLQALDSQHIGQYHLAGYTEVKRQYAERSETLLIDTHNHRVYPPVWALFEHALAQHGQRPTLFEWDSDFPELSVLIDECAKADKLLNTTENKTQQRQSSTPPKSSTSQKSNTPPKSNPTDVDNLKLRGVQKDFLDRLFNQASDLPLASKPHQPRIGVYQNNVFAALLEYLSEVYPATQGVLGAGFFKQLAHHAIQTNPPSEGNIHLYGQQFADKLNDFASLERFNSLNNLPYLHDLMRFEWALHSAYFSHTSNSINAQSLEQDALLVLPIAYNDSVSLIQSQYPIYEIHRQSLPDYSDPVAIRLDQSQDHLLVYKHQQSIHSLILSPQSFALLQKIAESDNLLQAIQTQQDATPAETLSSTLALVLDAQLLVPRN